MGLREGNVVSRQEKKEAATIRSQIDGCPVQPTQRAAFGFLNISKV